MGFLSSRHFLVALSGYRRPDPWSRCGAKPEVRLNVSKQVVGVAFLLMSAIEITLSQPHFVYLIMPRIATQPADTTRTITALTDVWLGVNAVHVARDPCTHLDETRVICGKNKLIGPKHNPKKCNVLEASFLKMRSCCRPHSHPRQLLPTTSMAV